MSNETNRTIHVTKEFPVGKEELYKAWTEEEQLKKWWKPMNKALVNVENEIREGGKVAYHFEDDLHIKGEYKDVAKGEKLVYSWNWELPEESMHRGEYLLTVQFKENGENSALDITQENFKSEHTIQPHEDGWKDALENLKSYLTNASEK